jgi:hypothetical protein
MDFVSKCLVDLSAINRFLSRFLFDLRKYFVHINHNSAKIIHELSKFHKTSQNVSVAKKRFYFWGQTFKFKRFLTNRHTRRMGRQTHGKNGFVTLTNEHGDAQCLFQIN